MTDKKKAINNLQTSDLTNCLVLHSLQEGGIDFKSFFEYAESFIDQIGLIPTRMAFGEKDSAKERTKTVSYKGGKKIIEKVNFNLTDLTIMVNYFFPYHNSDEFDFLIKFKINALSRKKEVVGVYIDKQFLSFNKDNLLRILKDITTFLFPQYGYCYQRNSEKAPSLYSVGILGGYCKCTEQEEKEITKWGHQYRLRAGDYQVGDLRDIYPLNILSEPHLVRDIRGQTLQSWIESSPAHGELGKINDRLWYWWVPQPQIEFVRNELKDTGIIIIYR